MIATILSALRRKPTYYRVQWEDISMRMITRHKPVVLYRTPHAAECAAQAALNELAAINPDNAALMVRYGFMFEYQIVQATR